MSIEDFIDMVRDVSQEKVDWKVSEVMAKIEHKIVSTAKLGHVDDNVYIAYFYMWKRLGLQITRTKLIIIAEDSVAWLVK